MTAMAESENLFRVCEVVELAPGNVKRVDVDPPIAVYNIDGAFYATADWCTHDRSSLADEGFVENGQVECGWHFAKFCVRTGAVTAPPATRPLATYSVRVIDGVVYVDVAGCVDVPESRTVASTDISDAD